MRISRRNQTGSVKSTAPTQGKGQRQQPSDAGGSGGAKGADGVSISAKASEVQQAKAALENVPDMRVEMVASIQNEIDDGTYKRDSKQVAKKIVNEHLRQSSKRKP